MVALELRPLQVGRPSRVSALRRQPRSENVNCGREKLTPMLVFADRFQTPSAAHAPPQSEASYGCDRQRRFAQLPPVAGVGKQRHALSNGKLLRSRNRVMRVTWSPLADRS
jgi:hypothetical protein